MCASNFCGTVTQHSSMKRRTVLSLMRKSMFSHTVLICSVVVVKSISRTVALNFFMSSSLLTTSTSRLFATGRDCLSSLYSESSASAPICHTQMSTRWRPLSGSAAILCASLTMFDWSRTVLPNVSPCSLPDITYNSCLPDPWPPKFT